MIILHYSWIGSYGRSTEPGHKYRRALACRGRSRTQRLHKLEEAPEAAAREDREREVIVQVSKICHRHAARQHPPSPQTLKEHAPRASVTPEIRPATMPRTPRPSHSLAAGQCQLLCAPTEGTTHPQNPTAMAAPVTAAAAKPATDFRGARGRRRRGRRAGSLGVRAPKSRPTVDAVVSAHERLKR